VRSDALSTIQFITQAAYIVNSIKGGRMFTLLAKLLKALNSDYSPSQIAVAICLGMIMGVTPLTALHNFFVLLIVLVFRVNLGIFLVSLTAFSGVAYLVDPFSELIGYEILTLSLFEPVWVALYSSSVFRLLEYNNTLVMGSLLLALVFSPALYWMSKCLVIQYRQQFMSLVQRSRLSAWLKGGKLMAAYRQL
jgi:uncharacterized protein (TIGR03546 family)